MKKLAARDFEDLLQVGLLSNKSLSLYANLTHTILVFHTRFRTTATGTT
jgi:hypothetical protein